MSRPSRWVSLTCPNYNQGFQNTVGTPLATGSLPSALHQPGGTAPNLDEPDHAGPPADGLDVGYR